MKRVMFLVLISLCVSMAANAQTRYVKVPAGYLMVLRQGDDLFTQLEAFMLKEKAPAVNFTGMGFVNARFGFFNQQTKEYDPRSFDNVELASMQGTIGWQQDSVSIHAHGVVTDKTFQAYGGHLLGATVSTGSLEIMITVHDKRFERAKEESIGANVLQLKD
ncbi:PPC domain-containing DNA-binding protein [Chitinophaga rhizophila]|uniref:DNA-binding protein n=1 Tax=Chitinophaga rhizophila TaxID=2866212 RepID=A0ABS7GJX0_9BACT|nr:PPC domain-containing DNA-binding protein [Chitinophaga rhizophila]MBW8687044.1 DNA-binding protein [Chitinophaga rhizophila]